MKDIAIIDKLKRLRRKFLIRWYGLKNVDTNFLATPGLGRVSKDIVAGPYSYIGPNCGIYPNVTIGKYTMLANDVMIIGGDHDYSKPGVPMVFAGRPGVKPTTIGDDVWVGARSTIMCGITVGNGAVIAAGSVVTKDIPPYTIFGGIPAKKIRDRFTPEEIKGHEEMLSRPPSKEMIMNLKGGKDK